MIPISYFSEQQEATLALLKRLVEVESPTADKAAVDRLGVLVAEELRALGMQVAIEAQVSVGDQIVGRWAGANGAEAGGILLLCHIDTVHPVGSLARNPCRTRDGRLYGPGVQDMKGGVAILISTLRALQTHGQEPQRPITALFTTDEETGSRASRAIIERLARESALVLCLEPCLANGGLKTARKGVGSFEIVAYGRAAHAGGDHQQGRNAIEELAHQVLAIQALTDYRRGTTLNVGVIAGGTVSNVVPETARAVIDLRVESMAEAARIAGWLQTRRPVLEGTRVEVSGGLNRPPMVRDDQMAAAFQRVQHIGRALGLNLEEGSAGGGSDANFVAPLGVTVLDGLGARGAGLHSDREQILITSLAERAALLAAILSTW